MNEAPVSPENVKRGIYFATFFALGIDNIDFL